MLYTRLFADNPATITIIHNEHLRVNAKGCFAMERIDRRAARSGLAVRSLLSVSAPRGVGKTAGGGGGGRACARGTLAPRGAREGLECAYGEFAESVGFA